MLEEEVAEDDLVKEADDADEYAARYHQAKLPVERL